MHRIILLLCNTHSQDSIFHLIWFKNAIIRLFWSYAIPSCLGYISHHIIERCNTIWTHWPYHSQPNSHMHYLHQRDVIPQWQIQISYESNHIHIYITFIRVMHIFWIILVFCNTFKPIEIISFYLFQQFNTLKTY
jgi:hypothetical protein